MLLDETEKGTVIVILEVEMGILAARNGIAEGYMQSEVIKGGSGLCR